MMSETLLGWRQLFARLLAGLVCLALFGCATPKVTSTSSRIGPTGIGPQDRISVIVVEEFEEEPEPDLDPLARRKDQSTTSPRTPTSTKVRWEGSSCLEGSIRDSSVEVLRTFVPAKQVVESAFPGQSAEDVAKILKSGDYLKQLSQPSTAARVASLNVRYLIIAHRRTTVTDEKTGGGSYFLIINAIWGEGKRSTSLEADVIDVAKGIKVGTASAHATGSRGAGMVLFVIAPIMPIGWSSPTESVTCTEIGKHLAQFILERSPEESRQAASELQRLREQHAY